MHERDGPSVGPAQAMLEIIDILRGRSASGGDGFEWQRKGPTLSDNTARRELGLTQDEIVQAIRAGKLQYRRTWIYGNPACDCSGERSRRWSRASTGAVI